jgi:hypothetical protein
VRFRLSARQLAELDQQERVKAVARETGSTKHDRHIIFREIGERLDLTAELVVANAFIGLWAQLRSDEIRALFSPIQDLLPLKDH